MVVRRLVFPDKGRCLAEETELEENLRETEILVRNRCTLVSAGTELAMFTKIHRGFADPTNSYARYPFYPGYSAVGEVVDGKAFPRGELVAYKGKHATYSKSGELGQCLVVDPEWREDPERFTFSTLLTTAMTARHVAPVRPGENVVVVGMGIVGNLAAQLYRMAGAGRVAGADLSGRRLEIARECGAVDLCFDTRKRPLKDWVRELGEGGAELVVDAVGLTASIRSCLGAVSKRGRVVLLGSPREKMEIDPYNDIHSPGVSLIGAHMGVVDAATRARDRILVRTYLGERRVRVEPLITHHAALDQAQAVYEGLRDRPDEYVGVIFRYD